MRKVIAAINMTIDGFCDHTYGIADEELHQHYTDLLNEAGVLLYGRITYQLMESYWPLLVKDPSGEKAMDDFALAIDRIPKIVFSNTLKSLNWESARLAHRSLQEEINALREQPGKDIFIGSPGLIAACTEMQLIDEYQLCIHPVIAGKGLPLFRNISDQIYLQQFDSKRFGSGAMLLYYKRKPIE